MLVDLPWSDLLKLADFSSPGDGEPEETVPAPEIPLMASAIVNLAPAICAYRTDREPHI